MIDRLFDTILKVVGSKLDEIPSEPPQSFTAKAISEAHGFIVTVPILCKLVDYLPKAATMADKDPAIQREFEAWFAQCQKIKDGSDGKSQ